MEILKIEKRIVEHYIIVRCLSYYSEKNNLFTTSNNLYINLIDSNNYKVIVPIIGYHDSISQMIVNDNKQFLYTFSFNKCLVKL